VRQGIGKAAIERGERRVVGCRRLDEMRLQRRARALV
jgi:hypothetical protein